MDEGQSGVEIARWLLRIRALRWDYFRGDLFDEYAWNILLVLFIAEDSQRETSEALAVQEASVPPAVGMRWIAHLEESGLVNREASRATVTLTDQSRSKMADYLQDVVRTLR